MVKERNLNALDRRRYIMGININLIGSTVQESINLVPVELRKYCETELSHIGQVTVTCWSKDKEAVKSLKSSLPKRIEFLAPILR